MMGKTPTINLSVNQISLLRDFGLQECLLSSELLHQISTECNERIPKKPILEQRRRKGRVPEHLCCIEGNAKAVAVDESSEVGQQDPKVLTDVELINSLKLKHSHQTDTDIDSGVHLRTNDMDQGRN